MINTNKYIESSRKAYGHIKGATDADCMALTIARLTANLDHQRAVNQMCIQRAITMERFIQNQKLDLKDVFKRGARNK